jgi:hypothetical protein
LTSRWRFDENCEKIIKRKLVGFARFDWKYCDEVQLRVD